MRIDHVFASGAVVGRATTHSTPLVHGAWWRVQPRPLTQKRGQFLHLTMAHDDLGVYMLFACEVIIILIPPKWHIYNRIMLYLHADSIYVHGTYFCYLCNHIKRECN